MRQHLKGLPCILALLAAAGLSSRASQANAAQLAARDDAASCAALSGKTLAPHSVIQSATYASAGETVAGILVNGPFCRVVGLSTPSSDSHIGFEVWLPPAASWNGNFRGEGSGGSAGALSPGPMSDALKAGYATMSTDNGHLVDPNDALGGSSQAWAYHHPQKKIDWAWRALHVSTVAAKLAVRRFYGRAANKNYFVACSAGGHHAIMEATRFPQDYDGMVAGAAPWKWTSLMFYHTWNSIPALKDPSALTAESVQILSRHMIAACDKLDGVQDGILADPRRCNLDPIAFQCSDSSQTDSTRSDGTRLMPGQVRGTELGWVPQLTGPHPGGSSSDFWKLTVFNDPNFSNVDFDFDKDTDRALATRIDGATLPEVYDEKPNLDAFRARGGKFILFQGWADPVITPLADLDFYNRIVARYGQAATDDFLRFFLLPGMGHCGGGVGISHIGAATGAPLQDDAAHSMIRAIEAWVQDNAAPSMFVGAHMDESKQVTATRPICRYPLAAQYSGYGDTKDAANFTCRASAPVPPQPM
ncbi:MAG: tannase/feruloyl esterase family alpha/beta hydrolase [Steroidobacteraceae bacterium]